MPGHIDAVRIKRAFFITFRYVYRGLQAWPYLQHLMQLGREQCSASSRDSHSRIGRPKKGVPTRECLATNPAWREGAKDLEERVNKWCHCRELRQGHQST